MKTLMICNLIFTSLCLAITATGAAVTPAVFEMRLVVPATANGCADCERMDLTGPGRSAGETTHQMVFVDRKVLLNQDDVKGAKVRTIPLSGQPEIGITFTEAGRKRFAEVTRQHIGQQLAIVINGRLYAAPIIKSEIPGGQANITGNFTREEAEDLARRINQARKK